MFLDIIDPVKFYVADLKQKKKKKKFVNKFGKTDKVKDYIRPFQGGMYHHTTCTGDPHLAFSLHIHKNC